MLYLCIQLFILSQETESLIHLLFHLSIHPSIYSSAQTSRPATHSPVYPCTNPIISIYPPTHTSIDQFIHPSINLTTFTHPSITPSIHPSIQLHQHPSTSPPIHLVQPPIHQPIHPSTHPSNHLSIHPFIQPSVHLSNHAPIIHLWFSEFLLSSGKNKDTRDPGLTLKGLLLGRRDNTRTHRHNTWWYKQKWVTQIIWRPRERQWSWIIS